ncbi:DUF4350 domain-containing protein [Halosimplex pelagicum]|uniref:DUF4350 domain-containing protein n=1 Tax=Halosimplex pelagicum TaxID=869886 RepID=A0A7D5PD12_9EURY|nr:DUF4350 domain-containing protein [Halosimplex pelagicum]QLH82858.1 hypothetical protein HZS54_15040 [Halosimplex pelagicum]
MKASEILKPLGVFVVVIAVVLAGTALLGVLGGSGSAGPADGEEIEGQSPGQFAPENVLATSAPEDGEISLDSGGESKRVLVDSDHSNRYSQSDLAPLVEALARAGHEVDFTPSAAGDDGGFGESSYNATLRQYDAVLIVQPTASFSDAEIAGLSAYADGGGRIAVLAEPPQLSVGSGLSAQISEVRFGAQDLVGEFGLRMGTEGLYNIEDGGNDNNYESIIASPDGSSALTEGVSNVTFDSAGYVVSTGDGAQVRMRALSGTRTLERRQAGQYPVAAQNDNMVLVADTSFLKSSELYDLDNEQFAGNLLEFLVSGDKDDDVPQGSGTPGGSGQSP